MRASQAGQIESFAGNGEAGNAAVQALDVFVMLPHGKAVKRIV
jgi:hypothetical protein